MLLGEDLGGRHERRLMPALDRSEHGRDRHHRLARPDVALEEAVHRDGSRQIAEDLLQDAPLGRRRREGQPPEEARHHGRNWRCVTVDLGTSHLVLDPSLLRFHGAPTHDQGELEPEQLIEGQSPSSWHGLLHRRRRMDPPHRVGSVRQVETIQELLVERVSEPPSPLERFGDEGPDLPAGQPHL